MAESKTFNHLIISDEHNDVEAMEIKGTMPYEVLKYSKDIPEEYLLKTPEDLQVAADLGSSDWKVKTSFWKNYKLAAKAGRRMTLGKMLSAISTHGSFRHRFLTNPKRLAWLLSPITPYSVHVESLLDQSMERYQELINMSINTTKKIKYKDEDGNDAEKFVTEVDAKKAMVLLSVIKNLEERTVGGAVQRNLSIKTTEPSDRDKDSEINMDVVNTRLKELEEKLGDTPVTIEV